MPACFSCSPLIMLLLKDSTSECPQAKDKLIKKRAVAAFCQRMNNNASISQW